MKKSLGGFIETFVVGILLSILIMVFVGQSLEISGESMYPTLKNGEKIVAEKVTYKGRQPKHGEIVVIRSHPNQSIFLIKRVIGLPGDTININGRKVVLNGKLLEETYLTEDIQTDNLGELEKYSASPIPEGFMAVMGDHRDESYDSRMFGVVSFDDLVGKAFLVYWPLSNMRTI